MREYPSFSEHDAELSLWLEDPNDLGIRDTRDALIGHLRKRGFQVKLNQKIRKHYPSISSDFHEGQKGQLHFRMSLCGRHLELRFYQTIVFENRNGAEYDFDRRQKMPYLIGKQYELERKKIAEMMAERGYPLKLEKIQKGMAFIEQRRASLNAFQGGRFYDKPPRSYNSLMRGDRHVAHGDTVYFRHRDGRLRVGTAYHNINNMWWVLAGGEAYNQASHELYFRDEIGSMKGRYFTPDTIVSRIERRLKRASSQNDGNRAEALGAILRRHRPDAQAA